MDLTDLWHSVEDTFRADTAKTAPAVSVGVLIGDAIEERALGTADLESGQSNTPLTLFEVGSITKPWTATVVMRLWERGLLDLDAPVQEVVAGFSLADDGGADITARQLLSHTAGIGPDTYDVAVGASIDCLLAHLRSLPPLWPAGSRWGYSNLGYVLLGHVIETITGQPYAQAMRTELLEVLDCPTASISGEATSTAPRAVGYAMSEPDGIQVVQAPTQYPGYAPAGSTPAATADHVLKFAAAHLNGGTATSGRLLQHETVDLMRRQAVTGDDDPSGRVAWGLGWGFWRVGDHSTVIGHGGSTPASAQA